MTDIKRNKILIISDGDPLYPEGNDTFVHIRTAKDAARIIVDSGEIIHFNTVVMDYENLGNKSMDSNKFEKQAFMVYLMNECAKAKVTFVVCNREAVWEKAFESILRAQGVNPMEIDSILSNS